MIHNIVPEYISCVLLALIGVYMLFDKKSRSQKEKIFQFSVVFAIIANINNIFSIYTMENAARTPVLLNVTLHTFYYFAVAVLTTLVSITTYATMFEGRYDEPRLKTAIVISLSSFFAEVALVLINLATGWLFYFDESRMYHAGALNAIPLAFLAIAIFNIIIFGILERKRMKKSFRMIIIVLPTISVIIGLVQFLLPDTVLTGTIIGFALLTLFIAGQQQRARVDALTELSNREAFFNDISYLCQKKTPYCIIIIGLKNFKQVNGILGQRAGDALLYSVGFYLSQLEPCAVAYRTSGVQFTLVVKRMDLYEYEALFQSVIKRFSQPWKTDVCCAELRAVFADVHSPEHAVGVDEVIASLEYATRLAKEDPTGKPVRFSDQLKNQFARRNYVISQMEKALQQDLFFLNIQPVYDIKKQRFTGGEVLLRLNEDNGMPISPGEFIPIAIETGIATKLGLMVMEKTCRFLHANQDIDIGWLSINISSQQDEFDETVHHLEMLLEQYDIESERIKLEITEMVLLEDLERAHATMDELNLRGIGVYLDDFGTGYSNLVNVMTLPFECVKIDKGFIRNVATHPQSFGMLRTVVQGLRSMNVIALAEGVETEEQDNIVRELGIDRIQGYYYARPMATEEFAWLISESCPIYPIQTE
ncbi:MAG: GGDEF domain-containing phosphodiesterase [Eubacteriales bacterium]|nr:GGDEF domain-containing phosphodiesterase [Eubacteriales bacterium]